MKNLSLLILPCLCIANLHAMEQSESSPSSQANAVIKYLLKGSSTFDRSDDNYDKEAPKIEMATWSRNTGTRGFQGCVNKEKCGEYGHYLKTYSSEGLCEKCEFERHPDRFVACLFCRQPRQNKGYNAKFCFDCSSRFQDALVKILTITDKYEDSHALEMGAFSYIHSLDYSVKRKSIKSFIDWKTRQAVCDSNKMLIYLGGKRLENGNFLHVWSQELNIDPNDKKVVAYGEEANKYVKNICEKYNVFGPETCTATLESIPANCLTYEEVIIPTLISSSDPNDKEEVAGWNSVEEYVALLSKKYPHQ